VTKGEPFEVAWSPTAQRDLIRLPEKIATAVVEFIYGALAESPERAGHRLRFELEGKFSANRGSYRIIYQIDDSSRVVTVLAIDHRSKAYRRR
jgi:mRNA-degrading endonuclease RelE of RelBE toxin-antitoxin system